MDLEAWRKQLLLEEVHRTADRLREKLRAQERKRRSATMSAPKNPKGQAEP